MDSPQLLVLMVPGDIRDDVVDTLMACDGISGFNMLPMAGYSKEHSQYDLREQVEGHRKLFQFEVMHDPEQEAGLLAALRVVCATANIRYWILPLLSQGHL